jgi:hypothetical protein
MSDYFREKIVRRINYYEYKAKLVRDDYLAEVEELAQRTRDGDLAEYYRSTLKPGKILSKIEYARALLQVGDIEGADQRLEELKTNVEFVESHLRQRYFTAGWRHIKHVSEAGKKRAEKFSHRNRALAEEFRERRKSTPKSKSDTAIKVEIGKENGLEKTAAIDAIDAGLKILSG